VHPQTGKVNGRMPEVHDSMEEKDGSHLVAQMGPCKFREGPITWSNAEKYRRGQAGPHFPIDRGEDNNGARAEGWRPENGHHLKSVIV